MIEEIYEFLIVLPSQVVPSPAARRVLEKHTSEPKTESEAAEEIAQQIKKAFDNKKFDSSDDLSPDSGSFCFRTYTAHLLKSYKSWKQKNPDEDGSRFVEQLDSHSALCIKFTIKMLLMNECFLVLPKFCKCLQELDDALPTFLPPLAKAWFIRIITEPILVCGFLVT